MVGALLNKDRLRNRNRHDSSKAVLLLWIFVLQVFVILSCASVF